MRRGGQNFKDRTGLVYGRLTVVRRSEFQTDSYAQWECLCSCGKTVTVKSNYLQQGDTKSCGCLVPDTARENQKKAVAAVRLDPEQSALNNLFSAYKTRASRNGIRFELSKEEFTELVKSNCFYCGVPPKQFIESHSGGGLYYNGIDRRENAGAYSKSNSLPCCKNCNSIKSDKLNSSETLAVLTLLRDVRGKEFPWES